MKVSGVSKDDCQKLAQLINMIHIAEYTAIGKDICAAADSIRWLQSFAKEVAVVFQAEASAPSAPPPTESGFTIKSSGQGKVGKK